MKYAFMSFSTPDLSLDAMLATARRFGYDGIEPRLDSGHAHGIEVATPPAQREDIRRRIEASGIAPACLATSLKYADPAQTDAMLSHTHDVIDLAGDLRAPVIRVFGGKIPAGIDRETAIRQVADSLKTVAAHAGERGVTIALETHDDWCDPEHVAAVIERVGHPAVAVNWDIMHPVRTGKADIDRSHELLRPWICHLHVHDGITDAEGLKLTPIGEGAIDHRRALELMLGDAYKGFISGEWIKWQPAGEHLPRELATLKGYEREAALKAAAPRPA